MKHQDSKDRAIMLYTVTCAVLSACFGLVLGAFMMSTNGWRGVGVVGLFLLLSLGVTLRRLTPPSR